MVRTGSPRIWARPGRTSWGSTGLGAGNAGAAGASCRGSGGYGSMMPRRIARTRPAVVQIELLHQARLIGFRRLHREVEQLRDLFDVLAFRDEPHRVCAARACRPPAERPTVPRRPRCSRRRG